ncbi:MAG: flagellar hook assembly protein FlgD [Woeseiaceae bacterium]|nr:flagellar hook assembly protein FlgD [Woeseiaceae bacterium]
MTTVNAFEDARLFAPPPEKKPRNELGQDDFLKLMIAQFQNQDPFKPMENGEFLGQLAQFSTVSGIDSLNSAFTGLAGSIQDEQALKAAALVGRSVLAVTDIGYLPYSGPLAGAVELDGAVSNVQLDVTNASGELVRRINLGEQQGGIVRFEWDGRNADGERLGAGHYQLRARVVRGTETESVPVLIRADIESVTLGQFGAGMTLNLTGGDALSLGQVYQIT